TLADPSSPTVNDIPNQTVCVGEDTPPISFSGTTGATYNWINDNTAINLAVSGSGNIPAFQTTNTSNNPIVATITLTPFKDGCAGTSKDFTITVHPIPIAPIVADIAYCQNETAAPLTASGSNLKWYNSPSGGMNIATPIPSTATVGTQAFWASQTINNCESTREKITVTVYDIPNAPAVADLSYCVGESAAALTAMGSNLKWYAASRGSEIATPLPSTSAAGTQPYWVSQTINNCESPRAKITVTIYPIPYVEASSNIMIDNRKVVDPINFSGSSGATFSWTNDNVNIGLEAEGIGDIPSFIATNNGTSPLIATIAVTPTANNCAGEEMSFTITVNPKTLRNTTDTTMIFGSIETDTSYEACKILISAATIETNHQVKYFASEQILLTTGFHAKAGSDFFASIQPCDNDDPYTMEETTKISLKNNTALTPTIKLAVHPNPADDFVKINYISISEERIQLGLFDITGKLVAEVVPLQQGKMGENEQQLATNNLEKGMYFLVLRQAGQILTKKLIITR
ncbi:MAG: T9SS type A sorting domain-containing protein, partial [Bacteroidota bacterium]